jgi:peroxiredoxin
MGVITSGGTMSISAGDIAPDFSLKNQFGETVTLSGYLEKGAVALVFFPLAFSGICTGELCELRDNITDFIDDNVQLIGISVDSHFAQRAFAETEGYDFPMLADFWPHGAVARSFGVFLEEAGIANRATFVIGQDGRVVSAFVTEPGQARELSAYRDALASL